LSTNFSATIFKAFFPVFLIICAVFGLLIIIQLVLRYIEKQKLAKLGIADIDRLSGRDFEKYLEVLFEKKGYKVTRTKYIGDYGADLVVESDNDKTVIQAKRFKGKVGVEAIQEAVASKGYYSCQHAMVVTNSNFTDQAMKLARANNVELWNREKLIDALSSINNADVMDRKSELVEAKSSQSVCAICGKPLSQKVFDYCMSNNARFKGKVYCFNCQKKIHEDSSLT
jgi:restriction system protein